MVTYTTWRVGVARTFADSTVHIYTVMAMPGGFTRARLPTPEVEAITTLVAGVCVVIVAGGGRSVVESCCMVCSTDEGHR